MSILNVCFLLHLSVVRIDLKDPYFRPGKRNYERTRRCLEKIQLSLIISWEPPEKEICPSSVAKFFVDLGYNVLAVQVKDNSKTIYEVEVPAIDEKSYDDDKYYDIVEWLGLVVLDGDVKDHEPDDFVSTYEIPEPKSHVGQVRIFQYTGFFTQDKIHQLWQALSELNQLSSSDWVAMYVQGFSDSPVAWNNEEHHFYTNGDNSYCILKSNGSTISCIQKCSRKRYKNKKK